MAGLPGVPIIGGVVSPVLTPNAGQNTSGTMGALLNSAGLFKDVGGAPAVINIVRAITAAAALTTSPAYNNCLYTITNANYVITLPLASTGTATTPMVYRFSKNDGTGGVQLKCSGSDTFDNGLTTAWIYNENCTLISYGTGWRWLERHRGLISIQAAISAGNNVTPSSPVNISYQLTDTELEEVTVNIINFVPSAAALLCVSLTKGGQVNSTHNYSNVDTTSGTAVEGSGAANGTYMLLARPGGTGAADAAFTIRRPWSTVPVEQFCDWKSLYVGGAFGTGSGSGYDSTAAAVSMLSFYPTVSGSTPSASFKYSLRGFRT